MSPPSVTKAASHQFTPPRPIDEYPEGAVKKMAVLFTDIVGSSKYFKSQGDIAGRKMLKQHQLMVSPVINEYGGAVVKFLGDSVLAYFSDPKEALKAAITIQLKFQQHNQQKDKMSQINIRLCVHFGLGIVEDKDIFGDVVNMAAKFLPMVKGDEIYISEPVYTHVHGLSETQFEQVDTSEKKDLIGDLALYRVIWQNSADLDPTLKTMLYVKPLLQMGKTNFAEVWEGLVDIKKGLWAKRSEKMGILPDKSVALILKDPMSSVDLSKDIVDYLKLNLGKDAVLFLPVQIIIDVGPYLAAGKLSLKSLKVNWEEIEPGQIHVSQATHNLLKNGGTYSLATLPDSENQQSFYKITINDKGKNEPYLFRFQNAMIQGDMAPCFYCGDRRHPNTECPSKQLTELTHFLNKLGYLPIEKMNTLFFNYLNGKITTSPAQASAGGMDDKQNWAFHGFFELRSIYQMRFFTTIWNSMDDNWNKMKETISESERGGLVWLGQDCIRVSNHEQAITLLEEPLKKNPHDYKAYCAMGFLYVDTNNYIQAKEFFKKAHDRTRTTPQKMYMNLLMARIYDLKDDAIRAERKIRRVLQLNPLCPEALYQDVIYKFRKGKKGSAVKALTKLIEINRDYFMYALIDPELSAFSDIIHPKLKNLTDEARQEAEKIKNEAQEQIANLEKWLGPDEKEVKEAKSLWQKMEGLTNSDSYYSTLDFIRYGTTIINMGKNSIERHRRSLSRILRDGRIRLSRSAKFINNLPYRFMTGSARLRLKKLEGALNKLERDCELDKGNAPGLFKEAIAEARELAANIAQYEAKLNRLYSIQQTIKFSIKFFKSSLIFQSANVLIALILFPIIAYYLNFLLPGINITPKNIWFYQKGVLMVGGVSGILMAALMSSKTLPKK